MSKNNKIHLSNTISDTPEEAFDALFDESCDKSLDSLSTTTDDTEKSLKDGDDFGIMPTNQVKSDKKLQLSPFIDPEFCRYNDICDKMNEISKEFDADVSITIANIGDKSRDTTRLIHKWVDNAIAAKINKKRYESEYQEYVKKYRDMINNSGKNKAFLEKRMSVDSIVSNDVNVQKMKHKLEELKQLEELYLYYADIIKGFGYTVRNSLDTLTFERGM